MIRLLRHPAVLIFAVLWLTADFVLLPSNAGAKRWVHRLRQQFGAPPPARLSLDVEFVVWRENGVLHVDQRAALPPVDQLLGFIRLAAPMPTHGWWAPIVERHGLFIVPREQDPVFSDPELKALLIDRVEQLPIPHAASYSKNLRDGSGISDQPLHFGYVRNGVAALVAFLLAIGLCSRIHSAIRWFVARRRVAAGHCPVCRYDLQGDVSHGCPECGWRRECDVSNS